MDSRERRTRDALGDALVELMHQKPFPSITVQNVLDRAGVARSTFYTHYRDKDDLLVSDMEEFFELMATQLSRRREISKRVAPVRELFFHVADMREFYAAMVASGKIHDAMELGRGHFARGIEQRLAGQPRARGMPAQRRTAAGHALAGALVSLLTWWMQRGMPFTAAEMDEIYHQMVWAGMGVPDVRASASGTGRTR